MNRIALLGYFILVSCFCGAQNVFDPEDLIIRYDKTQPLGSPEHPDPAIEGLQKWVSTPTTGVSKGVDAFDASSFKQYYIHTRGGKVAFRLKFPHSYHNPDSSAKKYPINLFLHGGGEVGCSTNGGVYNNEKQLWLGGSLFMDRVDKNQFDGFLLYPQLVVEESCFAGWGSAAGVNFIAIMAAIDSMAKYVRADIDRLLITGLSGGGYGAWRMAEAFPKLVAKIIPSAAAGSVVDRQAFVHIPIWFGTGGKDPDPSPAQAQAQLTKMQALGADIRYTIYPERGHSMWFQHWREPDFIAAMNEVHKANPLVFFQHSEFCTEEDVNARLGLTPGFYAYEWQKDGVTIATSTNGIKTILDNASVDQFFGNEIIVKRYGTYRARFKRSADAEWSDWSLKPAIIKTKDPTQTDPIVVDGLHSRVLPAPDGSTTVPLVLPEGYLDYQWYRVSDSQLVSSTRQFEAPVGVYKAKYSEQYGCGTEFSPDFKVVDATGSPKPAAASNLTAVPLSRSVIRLNWSQGSGETGFEVYRSTASGGPYQFVRLTAANATSFRDSNLVENTVYYYIVRAVNETGAALPGNQATVKTLVDHTPPSAPSNLKFNEVSGSPAVHLTWTPATDDDSVDHYDIYMNGAKVFSVPVSEYTVPGLDSLMPYVFVVKAVDRSGNVSVASNQVTYLPFGTDPIPIPGSPAGFAATATAYHIIRLTWEDTSANETGFELVRSLTLNGTYLPVGTAPANSTAFADSGLDASKRYYYQVRAIGIGGESPFSGKVSAVTLAMPATPVAPTQLTAHAEPNLSVSLSWVDNATNETGYRVYRSTDNEQFTLVGSLPANSNAYTDTNVQSLVSYYYYVAGINAAGLGAKSDTILIRVGNNAPVIAGPESIFVKAGRTAFADYSISDDPGDTVSVQIPGKPAFITLTQTEGNTYRVTASPVAGQSGYFEITLRATDAGGKITDKIIRITIGEQEMRSVYLNFGSNGKAAPAPWNNWLGIRNSSDRLEELYDENNTATGFSVEMVNGWSGLTNLGHLTGDNAGAVPDAVLESGLADNGGPKQIKIEGLNPAMQYNLVFVGSQNEGIVARSSYSIEGQAPVLDARYNTHRTANLNNLTPAADGSLTVTINRVDGSPTGYLNAIVIQEFEELIRFPVPDNLHAEAVDRSTIRLTWSDRTKYEDPLIGYELERASDSLFTDIDRIVLPANSIEYTDADLTPNTQYWYRVRTNDGNGLYSEHSKPAKAVTAETMVYVNFNTSTVDAPEPWNNLASPPISNFTTAPLTDQSGNTTALTLTLENEFNGEFTSGVHTGNNSGVVPDAVLGSDYWLDKSQLSRFRLSGLNHTKRYRIGFIGSSSPLNWFKDNYTATYTVKGKTVYLNSWQNSTKIVYIDNIAPDPDGKLLLDFSTTEAAGYGFNAGIIIAAYSYIPDPIDTIPGNPDPIDTIPGNPDPIDTIPGNPDPIDTIPGNPDPIDTIPGNPDPIDTIPGNPDPIDTIPGNPDPIDTIPGNPDPIDTIPGNPDPIDTIPGNPDPIDTIPGNPDPIDTIPGNPDPIDTIPGNPNPIDTIPDDIPREKVLVFPNPYFNELNLQFYQKNSWDEVMLEIYDSYGRLNFRRNYGRLPVGNATLRLATYDLKMRAGIYFVTLKLNGRIVQTVRVVRNKNP